MTLSDLSIRRPVFAWMLMLALMGFGAFAFTKMGVSLMPDVDFPTVSVSVALEGAAPEVMESEVADVIEDAVISIEGVREVSTSCRQGSATVAIEFELERDIDASVQDVQARLGQAARLLPRDVDPPVVSKSNPEDQPIMWVALYGDVPMREIMVYASDYLKDRFQTVPGVGEVFLGGLVPRSLRVWLDADRMRSKQITVQDVLAAIRREHAEIPAGQLETAARELNVRTVGELADAAAFGKLLITQRGGAPIHVPIRLDEVARVEDGLADVRRISRMQGERAVGFGIRKQRGKNTVEVADGVRARLVELQRDLPRGMTLAVSFDSSGFVKESARELQFNLLLAALLTSAVCFLFLGSLSSTVNVLLAIPTSILGTFLVLYFGGFTLNTFTLLGLTLAVGIVVDDAIMMLENIVRRAEGGEDRVTASIVGAREITFAATAATVAILAIFVPVVFMKGMIGKFFFHFGVTVSVAVMLSLLEALTLTPMRTSQFLTVRGHGWLQRGSEAAFALLARSYAASLAVALRWRWAVLLVALVAVAASYRLFPALKKEMVPSQDQSRFMVRFQTPPGSSLEFTDGKMKQAEAILMKHPALARYFAAIGGFGGGEVNTGVMFVTMKDRRERPIGPSGTALTQAEFMGLLRKEMNRIPKLRAIPLDMSQQGFTGSGARGGFAVDFSIRGPDWGQLVEATLALQKQMEASGLVQDVDTDYKLGMPELSVVPDRGKAYERGVSIEAIGQTINAMVGGVRAGRFTDRGHRYDVRIRAETRFRLTPEDIGRFWVRNQRGELVRLADVVRVEERSTLLSITRKNRERAIALTANLAPGRSQADVLSRLEELARVSLPPGYHVVRSGASQGFGEAFGGLGLALLLGVIVAYMVLASQFNSFLHPVTVLLALPFSAMGALLALWWTDRSLNIYSMIGLILLMGIVKKNSILLVDFTNRVRDGGTSVREALLEACPVRLRPILMTSIATVAAAVPPALGVGPGSEVRVPMAVTVIGGVIASTLLTLYVVPCAYSLIARLERGRRTPVRAEAPADPPVPRA